MASSLVDGVQFRPTAAGTDDFVVDQAVTGYQTPADASASNATQYSYYAASDDRTEWEIGTGNYTTADTTLARTTIVASSNGGSKVSFATPPGVSMVALADDLAAGSGDMQASTYDPNTIEGDAFDMAAMVEATDAKVMTSDERDKLDGIESGAEVNDVDSVAGLTGAITAAALRAALPLNINEQTGATYTFALTDSFALVVGNRGTAQTFTIPANASVAFPTGAFINVRQKGAGTVTITADTGVTLNATSTGSTDLSAQFDGVTLVKEGTNAWSVVGGHDGVS